VKRPPGKQDGRQACVRFTDADGKRQRQVDRGCYLVSRGWLQKVIAGTGTDFEWQQTLGGPWHPIHATVEEACELLQRNDRLGVGRRTVERCMMIRQRRTECGLTVY
jgi:hypothetical protein